MSNFLPSFEVGLLLALLQVLAFLPWALALGAEAATVRGMQQGAKPTLPRFLLIGWFSFIPYLFTTVLSVIGGTTGRLLPAARQMSLRQQLLIFAGAFVALVLLLGLGIAMLMPLIQERGSLERWGRLYGSVLQLQLVFDLFV